MSAIPDKFRRPIVLVGFMGSGKSASGTRLAERLRLPFVDLDRWIERAAGESVAGIFAGEGESGFRQRESEALRLALDQLSQGGVLAGGGGLFARPENRARLAACNALVVWLDAPLAEIDRRIGTDPSRPLFRDPAAIEELYRTRSADYAEADLRIDASGLDLEGVVDRMFAALRDHVGTSPPDSCAMGSKEDP
jgi:shikimate kinase